MTLSTSPLSVQAGCCTGACVRQMDGDQWRSLLGMVGASLTVKGSLLGRGSRKAISERYVI
jgi:hypothetical protein